jgi:hypothetical protein
MRYLAALCLTIIVMAAGCSQNSSGKVIVIDHAGNPIQGAAVSAVSLSINGAASPTDSRGVAIVPLNLGLQQTVWVDVAKAGYDPVQCAAPAQWPLRVRMAPTGTAKPFEVRRTTTP